MAGMRNFQRAVALLAGLVLLAASGIRPQAADTSGFGTRARASETQRQVNDGGQYYLAWWLPSSLVEALLRENSGLPPEDVQQRVRSLDAYVVFALTRGQEGAAHLEDVRDRADLLAHSQFSIDGQSIPAATGPVDPAAAPALAALRPILNSMLGRNGYGVEFALYPYAAGMQALDPTMSGRLEYTLYRKNFIWHLPLWTTLASAPAAVARATPVPVPAAPMAAPAAPAAVPAPAAPPLAATPAAPSQIPVQRRKIDPISGEEFPERYNYNPYTGQKLVSQ